MAIRKLNRAWVALAAGVLLVSGAGLAARADDCDGCDASRWDRFCSWCSGSNRCHRCHYLRSACRCYRGVNGGYGGYGGAYGAGAGYGGGYGIGYGGSVYDVRDAQAYSAQGYNIPIAVPLAPVVKQTYNYGWGLPSSRLTRVGMQYTQWYPDVPFSQTGGYLPAGTNPPVYQPTDTTQQGFYYVHAPRWGRYGTW